MFQYKSQDLPTNIDVYVDSDHAGCVLTRKTTGGFSADFGAHCVKTGSALQSTIALSSGESEYYQLVKGAAIGLSIQALLQDWGLPVGVRIHSDSSAARGICSRRGLGKMRHVQTRYLWIQERVAQKHISIHKIPGPENHSDILTKSVAGPLLDKHIRRMGIVFREGFALKQKVKLNVQT